MKVCAVTTWPPHKDGVALYSAELYKQIAKSVDLTVVANIPKQQGFSKSCEGKDGAVLRCWKRGPWYSKSIFSSVLKTRAHVVHLQHGWLLYGGFISSILFPFLLSFFRSSRKPCVVTMHTVIRKDAHIYPNSLVNFFARMAVLFVSRCIVQFSDKVIVHNRLMKEILQTEYSANVEKIVIIPHGVKKSSQKPESSQGGRGICILSLGFLRKGKGIECLIEAFKKFLEKYPDAKLVIVGGSHAHDKTGYSEGFKHFITPNIQKQVLFTGFVDEKSLEQLIWNSDIIVLQSTEPYYVEASGALAAVADYGKPVVCSKVPKFQSEFQNGEHCLAVAPSDSTELAQTLASLIENKELRNRLGKNLREAFKSRHWSAVAEEHINLYGGLL
ncbi:MAG: glycosyltransferase family 4 protein [Candidatus Bathyarchaeum sp.]|nr:MAG: glycosyltransferase family 4 protein [Candidatus Bathyarchaeum sp.]